MVSTDGQELEGRLAVIGVDDLRVGDGDAFHNVVGSSPDRADGDTVSALLTLAAMVRCGGKDTHRAVSVGEDDVLAAVDSKTVVLVVHGGIVDDDVRGRADAEGIGVVAAFCVAEAVVDGDGVDRQAPGVVDAEAVHGRVLDEEILDGGVVHLAGKEELGLGGKCELVCGRTYAGLLHTLTLPPLPPLPSHHDSPWPSRQWPGLPVTLICVPLTDTSGPTHSL